MELLGDSKPQSWDRALEIYLVRVHHGPYLLSGLLSCSTQSGLFACAYHALVERRYVILVVSFGLQAVDRIAGVPIKDVVILAPLVPCGLDRL
jgi:hypothetical protein